MRKDLKIRLFQATVESILLFGSETWTITETLAKRIDGCYTIMHKMVLDVHWPTKINNHKLYGKHLKVTSSKIRERRMKFAGHMKTLLLIKFCSETLGMDNNLGAVQEKVLWTYYIIPVGGRVGTNYTTLISLILKTVCQSQL